MEKTGKKLLSTSAFLSVVTRLSVLLFGAYVCVLFWTFLFLIDVPVEASSPILPVQYEFFMSRINWCFLVEASTIN